MTRRQIAQPWRISVSDEKGGHFDTDSKEHPIDFDEIVVGDWLHIERMSDHWWWMRVGNKTFDIDTRDPSNPIREQK